MGLPSGLKWCKYDIGASAVGKYGDTFSWGNIVPLSSGTLYPGGDDPSYNTTPGAQLTGNIPVGVEYDAARKFMGEPWRMPTKDEWTELKSNCNISDATIDGVSCAVYTSKINNKALYFPRFSNNYIYYWTCTISVTSGKSWYWNGAGSSASAIEIARTRKLSVRAVR